jgi:hypothetical protein
LYPLFTEYCAETLYGSLAGILVCSYLFLRDEVQLARLGILVAIVELTILFLFVLMHMI